jgi:hypothetical protein
MTFVADHDSNLVQVPRPIYAIARFQGFLPTDARLPDCTTGVLYQRRILVERSTGPERARFTLAHELGHDALHLECNPADLEQTDLEEHEADSWAAGLLMPHHSVAQALQTANIEQTIARWAAWEHHAHLITRLRRDFRVSLATTLQTLVDMGLVQGYEPWYLMFGVLDDYERALRRLRGEGLPS